MYKMINQLNQFLESSAKEFPNKLALVNGKNHLNYAQLNNLSSQFARYLAICGLERGARVVVSSGNITDSVVAFWGTVKFGGIISLVNVDISTEKLIYVLKDSGASLLVCNASQYKGLSKHIQLETLKLKNILLTDIEDNEKFVNTTFFKDTIGNIELNAMQSPSLDIDLASIIYTSGSTGEPKGVMLTHRNMIVACDSINQYLEHSSKDVIVSALPISFDYGLYQMIMAFSVGATLVLEENFIWPASLLKKIDTFKGTVLPVVPSMVPLLQRHGKRFSYDLSSIRCITNTGASLNPKHIEILNRQFKKAQIFSMYGLTECKRCTFLPPEMIDKKPASVGIAIPNTELWIIDDDGKRLGANQIGQLVIRGATVMKGYWKKPEQTEQKLKDSIFPNEKILYTGDYCWLDEEGYLYFHSRMDEVLKCRGIKVSPREIETILMQHPQIFEAAIIGADCAEQGVVIHAFVAASESIDEKDLHIYCKSKLTIEQRPQYISILSSLPKSLNGKINKLELKSLYYGKTSKLTEAL